MFVVNRSILCASRSRSRRSAVQTLGAPADASASPSSVNTCRCPPELCKLFIKLSPGGPPCLVNADEDFIADWIAESVPSINLEDMLCTRFADSHLCWHRSRKRRSIGSHVRGGRQEITDGNKRRGLHKTSTVDQHVAAPSNLINKHGASELSPADCCSTREVRG